MKRAIGQGSGHWGKEGSGGGDGAVVCGGFKKHKADSEKREIYANY